jgi:hypothetical protein
MADERISRVCSKCGLDDTHTHHVQYVAFTHPVTHMGVDVSISKHTQCCAEDGCEICAVDVEFARQVLDDITPGDAFTEFMTTPRAREHLRALFERVGIESEEFQFPSMSEE